jgi:hypothetical protein
LPKRAGGVGAGVVEGVAPFGSFEDFGDGDVGALEGDARAPVRTEALERTVVWPACSPVMRTLSGRGRRRLAPAVQSVGEAHAFGGEAVDVGGADEFLAAVAAEVEDAESRRP